MKNPLKNNERRRYLLLKNTTLASVGYALPIGALAILKMLDLVSYEYRNVIIISLWVLLSRLISYVIIKKRREITVSFASSVLWYELFNWMIIFIYLTTFLNEIRIAALFFAFIGIIFLLTNAGFIPSLLLTIAVAVSYTSVSYLQITYGQQAGSFNYELLYVSLFFMAALYLSFAAGMFKRQRQEVVEAKRKAESNMKNLMIAKKRTDAANRAKSDFLANMSHELRTPLNHIIGFTELMADKHFGALNETQEEYLNDVLTSSRHLLSLINDILDLSKVEAGKLELKPAKVDLKALLANSLTMVKEKSLRHDIKISLDINDAPETIQADERKLKQILYNLLSNAVKFTPEKGEVHIKGDLVDGSRLLAERDNGENLDPWFRSLNLDQGSSMKFVRVSVTDTGIGIRAEDLERIFKPFEQAESSASRRYQGTGLGLSLTRRLIELHQGTIWAESSGEGRGSTFSFAIPVKNKS